MGTDKLLADWQGLLRILQVAHYRCSAHYTRWNRILGVLVVAITTIVGGQTFASIEESGDAGSTMKLVFGGVAIAAAVLAALQTFLGFGELAEKHRSTAVRYGSLRRELEQTVALGLDPTQEDAFCSAFRETWDGVANESPSLHQRILQRVIASIGRKPRNKGSAG
jgi:hypothetical protein